MSLVDDILIVCSSSEEAKHELARLKGIVESLGLRLAPNKTIITSLSRGFEWLGMMHYSGYKWIHPDKLEQWSKPFKGIQRDSISKLLKCESQREKEKVIRELIKTIEKYMHGKQGSRVRWYAFIEDRGQWKNMDKFIHGIIRSCIRLSGIDPAQVPALPSIHAKINAVKKRKESHQPPNKGHAPSVE